MTRCEEAGLCFSFCAFEIMQYLKEFGDDDHRYWFRNSDEELLSDSCFAQSSTDFDSIINYTSADSMYEVDKDISLTEQIVNGLAYNMNYYNLSPWFYEVYDEAPSQQWDHVVNDDLPFNDYIPNVYTQAVDENGEPTQEEVEASGIYSWQKHLAENNEELDVPFVMNFGLHHTIETSDYSGLDARIYWGDFHLQAVSVRSVIDATFQPPPGGGSQEENSPEFICLDYYPFRYVDYDISGVTMCDDDWLFLIDHVEEGLDSTVIPARNNDTEVCFYAQVFGSAGGPKVYHEGEVVYQSYTRRKPAPQELRMLCNLALLHQAKGIFPYNLISYIERPNDLNQSGNTIMSSLLDRHGIPFDAPYEDWVYTGRWPGEDESDYDYSYIRPYLLPPWKDGFDPLYEVPDPPVLPENDPQNKQTWYTWLFEPYGILYNALGGIMAEIKTIGPEMHDLWWREDPDFATVQWDPRAGSAPTGFITPEVKVFSPDGLNRCYLFYVNRYCVAEETPLVVYFDSSDPPYTARTIALDHSRRFMMDGWTNEGVTGFFDTLGPGESRLVELISASQILPTPADVRITSPDVWIDTDGDSTQLTATTTYEVDIVARFYNMGTNGRDDVEVSLYDSTDVCQIGSTQYLDFEGLSDDPYRVCDYEEATFTWTPGSDDIGAHILGVNAETWTGEPDPDDNSTRVTFLVTPRDYATEVREDPWDMDEAASNPPAWKTNDIEGGLPYWDASAWTDSVSGMFEGQLSATSQGDYFTGTISLAIPDLGNMYIDTDTYHMLSLGMVGNNPNWNAGSSACDIYIKWKDSQNNESDWYDLDVSVGNGWDQYGTVGPVDLSQISGLGWGDGADAKEVWLKFEAERPTSPPIKPIDIRIGWITLEEG
jgi:hypothetical protein